MYIQQIENSMKKKKTAAYMQNAKCKMAVAPCGVTTHNAQRKQALARNLTWGLRLRTCTCVCFWFAVLVLILVVGWFWFCVLVVGVGQFWFWLFVVCWFHIRESTAPHPHSNTDAAHQSNKQKTPPWFSEKRTTKNGQQTKIKTKESSLHPQILILVDLCVVSTSLSKTKGGVFLNGCEC
jgi:hypothetical protein